MKSTIAALAATVAFASHAQATPADYQSKAPEEIASMERVDMKVVDGDLIAFYQGIAGRGTLRVIPAIAGDPNGAFANGKAKLDGETPGARRALMHMVDQNLERGTKALGADYELDSVTFDTMSMPGLKITCARLDRQQAASAVAAGKERLLLIDRLCTSQNGDDILTLSTTLPIDAANEKAGKTAQVQFTGEMFRLMIVGN